MKIIIDNALLEQKATEYADSKWGYSNLLQKEWENCKEDYKKAYLNALDDINLHQPFKIES